MEWRGIEWVVPVFEVVMLVLPVYGFITFYRRVKRGLWKKARALWLYATLVISPTVIYILFFFALVAFEEFTHGAYSTEVLARSFLILVGLGLTIWLVSTLVFGVALILLKSKPSSPGNSSESDT